MNQASKQLKLSAEPTPCGKRACEAVLSLLALPRVAMYRLLCKAIGPRRAMMWLSESIARKPGPLGVLYRVAVYRQVLAHVGRDVNIGLGTTISKAGSRIGNKVNFGSYVSVGWVDVGDGAWIADGSRLLSGSHHHAEGTETVTLTQVRIGAGAWIGANAVVMADVGDGATVGAGAVVTKPVAAHTKVAGVPAKPIGAMPGIPLTQAV